MFLLASECYVTMYSRIATKQTLFLWHQSLQRQHERNAVDIFLSPFSLVFSFWFLGVVGRFGSLALIPRSRLKPSPLQQLWQWQRSPSPLQLRLCRLGCPQPCPWLRWPSCQDLSIDQTESNICSGFRTNPIQAITRSRKVHGCSISLSFRPEL